MSQRARAREAEQLAKENVSLRRLEQQLIARLPTARTVSMRAELSFTQLWAKSGLGTDAHMLGVGPLEDDPLVGISDEAGSTLPPRPIINPASNVEPALLPVELDRIETDSLALQTSLAELLEYFHDAALLLSNTPSVRPVLGGYFTSAFGKRRDPMNGSWVMHKGIDIAGRIGSTVVAPADGVCIFAGHRGGYGLTLVVDHGYGLQTHYAHLSRTHIALGDKIKRGDQIADVGSTGRSTGPHLHYEVRRRGQPLNPMRFILD